MPDGQLIIWKGEEQTFANCFSRLLGLWEVVTTILGSSTPAHTYSSSMCVAAARSTHQ